MTYEAVRACTLALFQTNRVLHADDVTAGCGIVIDWRTCRSGETLQASADAFDTAQLFVAIVGPQAALDSLTNGR